MNLLERFKSTIYEFKYRKMIFMIAVFFSTLYHLGFLITFRILGVMPMFYFNFFSVTLFAVVSFLSFKINNFVIPYAFCWVEVVAHQILADYFIGSAAGFHFFILLIGLLAELCFGHHFILSTIYGLVSIIIFVVIEAIGPHIMPVYDIPYQVITVIKVVNISLTAIVIFFGLFIYALLAINVEENLEDQVNQKTEKLITLQNHIIVSLSNLVENRDQDTGKHILRTSAYAALIATKALKEELYPDVITEDFIDLIKKAAPMHDIGKIVVPDYVLKKPGKLTEDEFELMKKHTLEGERIIIDVIGISEDTEYVQTAIDVAVSHHERWDGTGYPHKLAAHNIPVSARIMAIADVFDALVSPRCYKEPFPLEKAFNIIQEESGTHFDPDLVRIFLENKNEVIQIFES